MVLLQEWSVRARLGRSGLVIEADPSRIAGRIFDRQRRKSWVKLNNNHLVPKVAKSGLVRLKRETRRFDIGDGGQFDLVPFEDGETYKRMHDIWEHKDALQHSATYRRILDALAANNEFRYKKYRITEHSEIVPMMRICFRDLLVSMAEDGYVSGKKSGFATNGMATGMVWRDGRLWHEEGATHRLAAARIVGLRSGFPLRVVAAHRDWLHAQGVRGLTEVPKLPRALRTVDGILSVQLEGRG